MINFIPIIPLSIVVYPREKLNMHIYEPKYIQLISECKNEQKPFGIPVVLDNKVADYGTLMEITEISRVYDTGEMDIKTRGLKVFRILEHINSVPDKLFEGAIVSYPHNREHGRKSLMKKVVEAVKALHEILRVNKHFGKADNEICSYDLAHEVGLTLEQEYQLLSYTDEIHRQEFLKRHLTSVLPVAAEMETLKEKIKLNGHFKNISGFNIS